MSDNNSKTLDIVNNYSEEIEDMYLVLKNHEEQYSLWPDYKPVPSSWQVILGPKSKEDCLKHVKENWTDMRPLSLRKKMTELGSKTDKV